jgi:hypothetical protein
VLKTLDYAAFIGRNPGNENEGTLTLRARAVLMLCRKAN